jgi:hypothetical protein
VSRGGPARNGSSAARATAIRALATLLAAAAGCVRPAVGGTASPAPAERASRDVISADEIAASHAVNAYEAIVFLRPTFLRSRGPTTLRGASSGLPVVYIDGVRLGGVEQLRDIPVTSVREIRRYSSSEATIRWGLGHAAGVIAVATKR